MPSLKFNKFTQKKTFEITDYNRTKFHSHY